MDSASLLSVSTTAFSPESLVNPLILINMGSEMIYILQQRLKAQRITKDKSLRVLFDTISALFHISLFNNNHTIFESHYIRKIFHNITHSSIMRLNDQSMDKLYDLMIMGLKLQVIQSKDACELIQCTLSHITNIKRIVLRLNHHRKSTQPQPSQSAADANNNNNNSADKTQLLLELINKVFNKFKNIYDHSRLSYGELFQIRKYLLQWLKDRKIKVSILLQKGLQSMDGHINCNSNHSDHSNDHNNSSNGGGGSTSVILPKYTQIPGTIIRITKSHRHKLETNLIFANSLHCHEWANRGHGLYGNDNDNSNTNVNIGCNLYEQQRSDESKSNSNQGSSGSSSDCTSLTPSISGDIHNHHNKGRHGRHQPKHNSNRNALKKSKMSSVLNKELNELALIVGDSSMSDHNNKGGRNNHKFKINSEENIKIDLFGLDDDEGSNAGGGGQPQSGQQMSDQTQNITIIKSEKNAQKRLASAMSELDLGENENTEDDNDYNFLMQDDIDTNTNTQTDELLDLI